MDTTAYPSGSIPLAQDRAAGNGPDASPPPPGADSADQDAGGLRLRSGAAARLAGVPVSTLRVWERRYGVVQAPKTSTGQRMYSPADVQRLKLIKQLTVRGHAIGTIAALDLAGLEGLAQVGRDSARTSGSGRLVLVGRALAHKLSAWLPGMGLADAPQVLDDLDAAADLPVEPGGVVVVELAGLHDTQAQSLSRWVAQRPGVQLIVLYGYGPAAAVAAVRACGAQVQREPVAGRELAQRVEQALAHGRGEWLATGAPPPRRFSDERLATLSEWPTDVACECPRHLADIVRQLARFERYSADCLSRHPQDAALHQALSTLAGQARGRFEEALQRLAQLEGAPGADLDPAAG